MLTPAGYVVRIALWVAAFSLPSIAWGVPVPHGPYLAVPVLAAYDDVGIRRSLFWLFLTLLYEMMFHIPVGTLSVPVAVISTGYALARRFIRAEPLVRAVNWNAAALMRALATAVAWAACLIILSAIYGALTGDRPFSLRYLLGIWYGAPAAILVAGCAAALAVLHRSRLPFRIPIRFGS